MVYGCAIAFRPRGILSPLARRVVHLVYGRLPTRTQHVAPFICRPSTRGLPWRTCWTVAPLSVFFSILVEYRLLSTGNNRSSRSS